MRTAIFEDFKWRRTLLIWGSATELRPLVDVMDDLAHGRRDSATLDGRLGTEPVGGAVVTLTAALREAVLLRQDADGADIQLCCSRERWNKLADLLRTLIRPGAVGHHYLDLVDDQPLQIIVSAAASTLRP